MAMANQTVDASRHLARVSGARAASGDRSPRRRRIARKSASNESAQTNEASDSDSNASDTDKSTSSSSQSKQSSSEPSYEKVERNSNSSKPDPSVSDWPHTRSEGSGKYAPVDVALGDHVVELDGSDAERNFKETHRLPPPDSDEATILKGPFSDRSDHGQPQVAFVEAGKRIQIHAEGQLVTETTFKQLSNMPDELQAIRPVRVVRDGTVQLLFCWSERGEESRIRYKAGIFKVIGSRLGRIFERTVAVRDSEDGELTRRGYFEFLRGDDHRFIRWTPADDEGAPAPDDSVILQWNRWEGVYRRPVPPPTAPDRES